MCQTCSAETFHGSHFFYLEWGIKSEGLRIEMNHSPVLSVPSIVHKSRWRCDFSAVSSTLALRKASIQFWRSKPQRVWKTIQSDGKLPWDQTDQIIALMRFDAKQTQNPSKHIKTPSPAESCRVLPPGVGVSRWRPSQQTWSKTQRLRCSLWTSVNIMFFCALLRYKLARIWQMLDITPTHPELATGDGTGWQLALELVTPGWWDWTT